MMGNYYTAPDLSKLDNVPEDLQKLKVWLAWKVVDNGDKKPKKKPFYIDGKARTGKLDTAADRSRLVTMAEAVDRFDPSKFSGLSVALGPVPGTNLILSGIDLDNSVKNGVIAPQAKKVINAVPGAYAEISPSGNGFKIFGTGDIGKETTAELEIYSDARHFTVTGYRIGTGKALVDLTPGAATARAVLLKQEAATVTDIRTRKTRVTEGGRNNALFEFAAKLRAGDFDKDKAWEMVLQRNAEFSPPLPEREVRELFESAYKYEAGPPDLGEYAGAHPEVVEDLKLLPRDVLVLPCDYVPTPICAKRIFIELARKPEMFSQGGQPVELSKRSDHLQQVTPNSFRSRIEGRGRRVKTVVLSHGKPVLKHKRPSLDNAHVLLATLEMAEHLPPIELVKKGALLVEHEGELRTLGHGYHPQAGGVLILGKDTPPIVDLQEATKALADLLVDFQFTAPADKSRAVANLIGPALRMGKLLKGHHLMNCAEADASQAGKGFILACGRAIYNESTSTIAYRQGGVGSLDESISQAILGGSPFITFDNLRGTIDSQFLESILTNTDTVEARVPRRPAVWINPDRVVFQLTSNGWSSTKDLGNRSLITRIKKQDAGYQFKEWPDGSLLEHIEARHSYYLGCVFAVIRKWHADGKQRLRTSHTFKEWVGTLDWIVQKIFALPPLLEGHDDAVSKVSNPSLTWLRAAAIAVLAEGKAQTQMSASAIAELCEHSNIEIPGSRSEAPDMVARTIGKHMGQCFKDRDVLIIDDIKIRRVETFEYVGAKHERKSTKRYDFAPSVEIDIPGGM